MVIAVASGKGGTGKTTVAVNLARVLGDVQFLDCDVEEPNAHLFLKPDLAERIPARVMVPEVIEEKCTYCGKCAEVCAFNAIAVIPPRGGLKGGVLVFPNLCHSCGGLFPPLSRGRNPRGSPGDRRCRDGTGGRHPLRPQPSACR